MNMSMLNAYHECTCKLFEKNCHITQCFKCQEFDHMIRFCRKNQRCVKCTDKHHIKKCMTSSNKRRCTNAMKIINSEDASVLNDNSKWNKCSKSIKTDHSNIQKHLNIIAHSCNSWTLHCLQALQIQWTLWIQWTFWVQWILQDSRILSVQRVHWAQQQLCWKHAV